MKKLIIDHTTSIDALLSFVKDKELSELCSGTMKNGTIVLYTRGSRLTRFAINFFDVYTRRQEGKHALKYVSGFLFSPVSEQRTIER
jgi:hypothetical protein